MFNAIIGRGNTGGSGVDFVVTGRTGPGILLVEGVCWISANDFFLPITAAKPSIAFLTKIP